MTSEIYSIDVASDSSGSLASTSTACSDASDTFSAAETASTRRTSYSSFFPPPSRQADTLSLKSRATSRPKASSRSPDTSPKAFNYSPPPPSHHDLSPPPSPRLYSLTTKITSSLRRTFARKASTRRVSFVDRSPSDKSPPSPSSIVRISQGHLLCECTNAKELEDFIWSLPADTTELEFRFPPLDDMDLRYTRLRLPSSSDQIIPLITSVKLRGWNMSLLEWLSAHFFLRTLHVSGELEPPRCAIQRLIEKSEDVLEDLALVMGTEAKGYDLSYVSRLKVFHVQTHYPDALGFQTTMLTVSKVLRLHVLEQVTLELPSDTSTSSPSESSPSSSVEASPRALEHSTIPFPKVSSSNHSSALDDFIVSDFGGSRYYRFDFDDNYLVAKDGLEEVLGSYDPKVSSPVL